ncbi:MAG: N-acyl-D-amino-acid deacylase family protein [Planctomycetota bacterium]|jgi:N-acyl-D-amino-acid deacylase
MKVKPPVILKNGTVYDGTGSEPFASTVVVRNGLIENITDSNFLKADDARVIDIKGLAVSPGFIDIHAHGDLEPLALPEAESKILNGVTTEVCGNCGSSPFPIINHYPGYLREKAEQLDLEINWTNARDFFREVDKKPAAINRIFLLGHGRMRSAVVGSERRGARADELEEMREITNTAMRQGVWGLSTGLAYAPGCHADTEEIIELCKIIAKYDGIYTTHIRSEGDDLIDAVKEALDIADKSGVKLQISHLKISGEPNWHKLEELKELLFSAFKSGVKFGADWYPYEAWNANLDSILPDWVYEGGTARLLSRLRDPALRTRLAEHVIKASQRGMSWDKVIVGTVTLDEHQKFQGRSIADISEELALSPEDTYFNLILAEGGRADGIISTMSEEIQREIISWPFVSICSDATARLFEKDNSNNYFHPRTYGTASRFLRRVREENFITMQEAVKKLTSLPASQLGLRERGILKKDKAADLVVFNPEKVTDTATFESPASRPEGIEHVFVNGSLVVENSKLTGAYPGKLIRKTGDYDVDI